jgi:hypothetical protein
MSDKTTHQVSFVGAHGKITNQNWDKENAHQAWHQFKT